MVEDLDIIYSPSLEKALQKMADIDINPFGEHESRTDDHTETGENIPFTPVGGGTSTWEPECEQETSFGGESQRTKFMKD